jgi:hypothetical protein
MRRFIRLAVCFSCVVVAAAPHAARAEVFVLKSGGRVEGEHLNPNREAGNPYLVRTNDGVRLALADSTIFRVIVKTDVDKQYEAMLPKLANTVEAQWGMAEWCKEAGLSEQRKRHLQAVVAIDPNHAEARKALGYQRYGTRWLTSEQFLESHGYVRSKGAWRLRQEIEIEDRETQFDLASKRLRKDILRWLGQTGSGGRNADLAERELNAINDPAAATALAEVLGDPQQPARNRQRCLTILTKLPPGLANNTLIRVAMEDADGSLRDACLDELKRQGAHVALPAFISELKSKDNRRVNRAADCIAQLGDKSAALPLINALVTEHTFRVQQGPPPGSMTGNFSNNGPGGSNGPSGLSMGGKTQTIKKRLENASVRDALAALFPGVQLQYDIEAWRTWYTQTQTTSTIHLRRDN